jgi:hypothetical protein
VNSVKEMPDSEARRDLTLGYRSTIEKGKQVVSLNTWEKRESEDKGRHG